MGRGEGGGGRCRSLACVKALPATLPVSHSFGVVSLTSILHVAVWAAPPTPTSTLTTCLLLLSANTSLLQGFRCQAASQLSRDQLSALIRRMASQQVLLKAWQVRSPGWHGLECRGQEQTI